MKKQRLRNRLSKGIWSWHRIKEKNARTRTWKLVCQHTFLGVKIQKMLVLQAKEEGAVPCWLLPECGILGSWAAGWWHLMVPRPSPRDGRARARRRSSSHSPGPSNSTLSPGTPSLSTRANHSNFSLITEILTVVIGEMGQAWLDWKTHPSLSEPRESMQWWRGPASAITSPSSSPGSWSYGKPQPYTIFKKLDILCTVSTLPVILSRI